MNSLATVVVGGLVAMGALAGYGVYRVAGRGAKGLAWGGVALVGAPAAYLTYQRYKHQWQGPPAVRPPMTSPTPTAPRAQAL